MKSNKKMKELLLLLLGLDLIDRAFWKQIYITFTVSNPFQGSAVQSFPMQQGQQGYNPYNDNRPHPRWQQGQQGLDNNYPTTIYDNNFLSNTNWICVDSTCTDISPLPRPGNNPYNSNTNWNCVDSTCTDNSGGSGGGGDININSIIHSQTLNQYPNRPVIRRQYPYQQPVYNNGQYQQPIRRPYRIRQPAYWIPTMKRNSVDFIIFWFK